MSVGLDHACAIHESGELACWGLNDQGQTDAPSGRYRSVSAGLSHTCAVRESGEAVCWGQDGGPADVPALEIHEMVCSETGGGCTRTKVGEDPLGYRFRAVATGNDATCGILESGELLCWGDYADAAPTGYRFRSLSAGWDGHFCGITESGRVRCWGNNSYGRTDVPEEPVR